MIGIKNMADTNSFGVSPDTFNNDEHEDIQDTVRGTLHNLQRNNLLSEFITGYFGEGVSMSLGELTDYFCERYDPELESLEVIFEGYEKEIDNDTM